jgi:hypothetical protein
MNDVDKQIARSWSATMATRDPWTLDLVLEHLRENGVQLTLDELIQRVKWLTKSGALP